MRMFITSKNKYLLNDMKLFGTCSIPLSLIYTISEFDTVFDVGDVNSRIGSKQDFVQILIIFSLEL